MAMKKIMMVPCEGKDLVEMIGRQIALRVERHRCWARIIAASTKPRSSITKARITYMMPIRLWSTLVSHSRQR